MWKNYVFLHDKDNDDDDDDGDVGCCQHFMTKWILNCWQFIFNFYFF